MVETLVGHSNELYKSTRSHAIAQSSKTLTPILPEVTITIKNMNDNTIDSLKEALKYSPDNNPLRLLLAETLLASNRLEEAEIEFSTLLKLTNDTKAKVGLAKAFFKKGSFSA
jgi:thioredoxin-like negative regulator of GroEL